MTEATNTGNSKNFGLLAIPGLAVALLPSLACPLCWPAYAALLSSLGLGFLGTTAYLLPMTGVFLAIAVAGLAWQIKTRGYGPFALGLLAAAIILPGKFLLDSNVVGYAGAALLVIASVWSLVPQRSAEPASCPACAPSGEGSHQSV